MKFSRRALIKLLSITVGTRAGVAAAMSQTNGSSPNALPTPGSYERPIPELPIGWQRLAYSILRDGTLGILATDVDLRSEWRFGEDGRLLGDPFQLASNAKAQFFRFDGLELEKGPQFELEEPLATFDRFPDGRWLIATPRTHKQGNARLIASDGELLGQLHIGDGIEHLKIDDDDRIWVGWFDEGVFGNDDWEVEGHEWPPSSYGLAAFDSEGALVAFAENPPAYDQIADCYALNVVADTAWACTYSGFPILACNARSGSRWWQSNLSGIKALAIRPPFVLAVGGYTESTNRAVLVRLGEGDAYLEREWRLPFSMEQLRRADLFDGRGTEIHVVEDGTWHTWSIDQFITTEE